jgi:hypothetical protein
MTVNVDYLPATFICKRLMSFNEIRGALTAIPRGSEKKWAETIADEHFRGELGTVTVRYGEQCTDVQAIRLSSHLTDKYLLILIKSLDNREYHLCDA